MSVRKPLEALFSHLYQPPPATEASEPTTSPQPTEPALAEAVDHASTTDDSPHDVLPDEYETRIGGITAGLEATLQQTKAAADHLNSARQLVLKHDLAEVVALDQLHGRVHRKLGLPPGEPLQALDSSLLDSHGLLRARDLLREVQADAARRSAQAVGGMDIQAEEASSRPPPHYMLSTKAFDTQLETKHALISSVRSLKVLRDQRRTNQLNESTTTPAESRKVPPQLTMEEQQENARIIQRMHGPLTFMRNPRYVLPPRKVASEAPPVPSAVPRRDAFIHMIPEKVQFADYEAGGLYEVPVMLQNVSTLSRRVRVLPPSSKFFSITFLSYPSTDGDIAPGMHATMRIRFAPDALSDFDDFLVVQTETDSFPYPLYARRTPPSLTLPALLNCGCCFVGGEARLTFAAKNEGGAGRFYIVEKERWEDGDREVHECVEADTFTVSPTLFDLQSGDEFSLDVSFKPLSSNTFSTTLLVHCDNCQTKELRVCGTGCVASLQLESIDGTPPTSEDQQQETVDFGEVGVHTRQVKELRLVNTTPLPLDFTWSYFHLPQQLVPLCRLLSEEPELMSSTELLGPLDPGLSLSEQPFSITPRHGSLAAGEAVLFEIAFEPQLAQLATAATMLQTLNVPASAMPGASELPEVGLRMMGRGVGSDLQLIDASGVNVLALLLHGGTQLGNQVVLQLRLRNPNDSARTFKWVDHTPPIDETSSSLHLQLEPPEGEVDGQSDLDIRLSVRGCAVGLLRSSLRLECAPHGRPIDLPVELHTVGPRLIVRSRCLNYGLVPLGESRVEVLELENLSELATRFMLLPAALPTAERAGEVAAEQKRLLEQVGWEWADNPNEMELAAAPLSAVHHAVGVQPAQFVGLVEGRSTLQVPVTLKPVEEASVRRTLAVAVQNSAEAEYVNIRAEVVARRACLSLSQMELGLSYVRVKVRRTLLLTNLTNIPTDFAWRMHTKQGKAEVVCTPSSGTLEAGQQLSILVEMVPLEAGPFHMLLGCEIHGGTAPPVGFWLRSEVQGLIVQYEVVSPDDERLRALAPKRELVDGVGVSVRARTPSVDFGQQNAIFESKSLVVIMRNLSAIHTSFSLAAATYPAAELPVQLDAPPSVVDFTQTAAMVAALKRSDAMAKKEAEAIERAQRIVRGEADSTVGRLQNQPSHLRSQPRRDPTSTLRSSRASSVGTTTASSRPILSDAHEISQPFFSQSGVTFSAQRALRLRETALLASRRGAAFEISPDSGELEPWGQVAVTVSLHSNMWGCFDDQLTCDVVGLPPSKLPLLASVVGSPLRLHDATLGLSNRTSPPSLSWAPVPVGAPPQSKTIRVENLGTEDARMTWSVTRPVDSARRLAATLETRAPLVELEGEEGEEGESFVKQVMAFALRDAIGASVAVGLSESLGDAFDDDEAPFSVSPVSAHIPRGGEFSFQVAFEQKTTGRFEAMLVGKADHPLDVKLPDGSTSRSHPDLKLRLAGDTLTPWLELSERSKLKFKVASTQPKSHPSYTRPLILKNQSAAPLEFCLHVAAPFNLVEATASAAQFKLLGRTIVNDKAPFVLAPKESLKAIISYVPKRPRRAPPSSDDDDTHSVVSSGSTMKTERSSTREAVDQDPHVMHRATVESLLTITFSNGTLQTFPLVAITTSPFLELSQPSVAFKRSHIHADRELELGLFNPTEVDATWSVSHVPASKPTSLTSSRHNSLASDDDSIDDPSVFVFSSDKGVVPARHGNIPERVPLQVRFKPKGVGVYKCDFMFKVERGISTRCQFSAEATLQEEDLDVNLNERHLRLLVPGLLS